MKVTKLDKRYTMYKHGFTGMVCFPSIYTWDSSSDVLAMFATIKEHFSHFNINTSYPNAELKKYTDLTGDVFIHVYMVERIKTRHDFYFRDYNAMLAVIMCL